MSADPTPAASSSTANHSIHRGEPDITGRRITPWAWVPTVNFLQGLQYAIAIQLFAVIFKTMGIPNGPTLLWASLLSLPWTIKPLWGPLVDRYGTRRNWTIWMQFAVGVCLLGAALSFWLPVSSLTGTGDISDSPFFFVCIGCLLAMGMAAATHDIACDGHYMLALNEKQQAFFVGVRSTVFRLALMTANGLLIAAAGWIQGHTGPSPIDVEVSAWRPDARPVFVIEDPVGFPVEEQHIVVWPTTLEGDAGTTATLSVRLGNAPPPGHPEVVTVRLVPRGNFFERVFMAGNDQGIKLDTQRIEFTADNWREPATITATLPTKIRDSAHATYRFEAGNIPFSWSMVLLLCAGVYFVCFIYHRFTMPKPGTDLPIAGDRPPFYQPVLALTATVAVPWALGWAVLYGVGKLEGPLQTITIGDGATALAQKGFTFFFTAGKFLVLIILAVGVWFATPARRLARMFFFKMSDVSRIGFAEVFVTFFQKEKIILTLAFLLTFRLGEAQLAQVKNLFLIDLPENMGLGMSLGELAFTNTFVYLLALTVGGLLGGFLVARYGLRRMIWWMVAGMHLPNFLYVYLGTVLPENLVPVNVCVGIEAFGYGFGFVSYLLVMIVTAKGSFKTAHYALCTGFMTLGYMIPGMWSGYLQELVGYRVFFWLVILFSLPGLAFIPFLPIDEDFGKKEEVE